MDSLRSNKTLSPDDHDDADYNNIRTSDRSSQKAEGGVFHVRTKMADFLYPLSPPSYHFHVLITSKPDLFIYLMFNFI